MNKKNLEILMQVIVSIVGGILFNYMVTSEITIRILPLYGVIGNIVQIIILIVQIILIYFIIILIKNRQITPEIKKVLIICYFIGMIVLLFGRNPFGERTISFDLSVERFLDFDVIGNILYFIPLGIILKKYNIKKGIIIVFLFILMMETMQYIFNLGVFDILDIICNIMGYLIGFVLYKKILCKYFN